MDKDNKNEENWTPVKKTKKNIDWLGIVMCTVIIFLLITYAIIMIKTL